MSLQSYVSASLDPQPIATAKAAQTPLDWQLVAVGPATPIWQRLVALIGLLLLSPVILLICIATKSTSPGPILYRGQRAGRGGKTFTIYKFRTLEVGAEQKIGARLLEHGDVAGFAGDDKFIVAVFGKAPNCGARCNRNGRFEFAVTVKPKS